MQSSLPPMEHFSTGINIQKSPQHYLCLSFKITGLEISKALEEYLEKEVTKVKAILYDISDDCTQKLKKKLHPKSFY